MPEQILLDNDVALKIVSYALVHEMVAAISTDSAPIAMLRVGRFVVRGKLDRASKISDVGRAKAAFEQLLTAVVLLEPDDDELKMAADLEAQAIQKNLELDGGESQLLAIVARRACRLLLTGDKRAIAAMATIALKLVNNRVACLE